MGGFFKTWAVKKKDDGQNQDSVIRITIVRNLEVLKSRFALALVMDNFLPVFCPSFIMR